MYCRMSGCMPGLYSVKASSILYLPLVATKMSPHMASVPQARTVALVSGLEGAESCQFSPKWSHYLRATIGVCKLLVSAFSEAFNTVSKGPLLIITHPRWTHFCCVFNLHSPNFQSHRRHFTLFIGHPHFLSSEWLIHTLCPSPWASFPNWLVCILCIFTVSIIQQKYNGNHKWESHS